MRKYYTGIGSRETPHDILEVMKWAAGELYDAGYTLRSGSAPGADQAFEFGVADKYIYDNGWHCAEIYLPWANFEKDTRSWIVPRLEKPTDEAYELAAKHHPRWKYLSFGAKALHARNMHQVLGPDILRPVQSEFIVCWTKDAKGGGGTGQALRLGKSISIPIYDLADEQVQADFIDLILDMNIRKKVS